MKMMVDPPSGWMYGFPDVFDSDVETIQEMLIRKGYPRDQIEFALSYTRIWPYKDPE